jgi:hypothetical protein
MKIMKVDEADEGQEKITALLTVVINKAAPPRYEDEAPFQNT